jgi:chitin synthase
MPLNQFLRGCKDEFGDVDNIMSCATANKYLAEDRIMCLEIIAKKKKEWIIRYIPGAKCLTDPPLSLVDLVKQRRRWFNGSMFATFHVMGSMCRIWKRSCRSFFRNILFMYLYMYMLVLLFLSFILVGLFYAAFSIFMRATFSSDDCYSITSVANVLENLYLIFLFGVLMLSTTVNVDWAEWGFRVCSVFMGAFTILMVVASVFYALDGTTNLFSIVFIGIFIASYIVPLLLNLNNLKIADFLKGAVYGVYMSPTYVNIFTIFAISNIHDVSWGSRPTTQDVRVKAAASRKDEMYKDFRANFLIVWLIINIAIGTVVTTTARGDNEYILLGIGIFLASVLFIKLILALLYVLMHWWHQILVAYKFSKIKKSGRFDFVRSNNLDDKRTGVKRPRGKPQ